MGEWEIQQAREKVLKQLDFKGLQDVSNIVFLDAPRVRLAQPGGLRFKFRTSQCNPRDLDNTGVLTSGGNEPIARVIDDSERPSLWNQIPQYSRRSHPDFMDSFFGEGSGLAGAFEMTMGMYNKAGVRHANNYTNPNDWTVPTGFVFWGDEVSCHAAGLPSQWVNMGLWGLGFQLHRGKDREQIARTKVSVVSSAADQLANYLWGTDTGATSTFKGGYDNWQTLTCEWATTAALNSAPYPAIFGFTARKLGSSNDAKPVKGNWPPIRELPLHNGDDALFHLDWTASRWEKNEDNASVLVVPAFFGKDGHGSSIMGDSEPSQSSFGSDNKEELMKWHFDDLRYDQYKTLHTPGDDGKVQFANYQMYSMHQGMWEYWGPSTVTDNDAFLGELNLPLGHPEGQSGQETGVPHGAYGPEGKTSGDTSRKLWIRWGQDIQKIWDAGYLRNDDGEFKHWFDTEENSKYTDVTTRPWQGIRLKNAHQLFDPTVEGYEDETTMTIEYLPNLTLHPDETYMYEDAKLVTRDSKDFYPHQGDKPEKIRCVILAHPQLFLQSEDMTSVANVIKWSDLQGGWLSWGKYADPFKLFKGDDVLIKRSLEQHTFVKFYGGKGDRCPCDNPMTSNTNHEFLIQSAQEEAHPENPSESSSWDDAMAIGKQHDTYDPNFELEWKDDDPVIPNAQDSSEFQDAQETPTTTGDALPDMVGLTEDPMWQTFLDNFDSSFDGQDYVNTFRFGNELHKPVLDLYEPPENTEIMIGYDWVSLQDKEYRFTRYEVSKSIAMYDGTQLSDSTEVLPFLEKLDFDILESDDYKYWWPEYMQGIHTKYTFKTPIKISPISPIPNFILRTQSSSDDLTQGLMVGVQSYHLMGHANANEVVEELDETSHDLRMVLAKTKIAATTETAEATLQELPLIQNVQRMVQQGKTFSLDLPEIFGNDGNQNRPHLERYIYKVVNTNEHYVDWLSVDAEKGILSGIVPTDYKGGVIKISQTVAHSLGQPLDQEEFLLVLTAQKKFYIVPGEPTDIVISDASQVVLREGKLPPEITFNQDAVSGQWKLTGTFPESKREAWRASNLMFVETSGATGSANILQIHLTVVEDDSPAPVYNAVAVAMEVGMAPYLEGNGSVWKASTDFTWFLLDCWDIADYIIILGLVAIGAWHAGWMYWAARLAMKGARRATGRAMKSISRRTMRGMGWTVAPNRIGDNILKWMANGHETILKLEKRLDELVKMGRVERNAIRIGLRKLRTGDESNLAIQARNGDWVISRAAMSGTPTGLNRATWKRTWNWIFPIVDVDTIVVRKRGATGSWEILTYSSQAPDPKNPVRRFAATRHRDAQGNPNIYTKIETMQRQIDESLDSDTVFVVFGKDAKGVEGPVSIQLDGEKVMVLQRMDPEKVLKQKGPEFVKRFSRWAGQELEKRPFKSYRTAHAISVSTGKTIKLPAKAKAKTSSMYTAQPFFGAEEAGFSFENFCWRMLHQRGLRTYSNNMTRQSANDMVRQTGRKIGWSKGKVNRYIACIEHHGIVHGLRRFARQIADEALEQSSRITTLTASKASPAKLDGLFDEVGKEIDNLRAKKREMESNRLRVNQSVHDAEQLRKLDFKSAKSVLTIINDTNMSAPDKMHKLFELRSSNMDHICLEGQFLPNGQPKPDPRVVRGFSDEEAKIIHAWVFNTGKENPLFDNVMKNTEIEASLSSYREAGASIQFNDLAGNPKVAIDTQDGLLDAYGITVTKGNRANGTGYAHCFEKHAPEFARDDMGGFDHALIQTLNKADFTSTSLRNKGTRTVQVIRLKRIDGTTSTRIAKCVTNRKHSTTDQEELVTLYAVGSKKYDSAANQEKHGTLWENSEGQPADVPYMDPIAGPVSGHGLTQDQAFARAVWRQVIGESLWPPAHQKSAQIKISIQDFMEFERTNKVVVLKKNFWGDDDPMVKQITHGGDDSQRHVVIVQPGLDDAGEPISTVITYTRTATNDILAGAEDELTITVKKYAFSKDKIVDALQGGSIPTDMGDLFEGLPADIRTAGFELVSPQNPRAISTDASGAQRPSAPETMKHDQGFKNELETKTLNADRGELHFSSEANRALQRYGVQSMTSGKELKVIAKEFSEELEKRILNIQDKINKLNIDLQDLNVAEYGPDGIHDLAHLMKMRPDHRVEARASVGKEIEELASQGKEVPQKLIQRQNQFNKAHEIQQAFDKQRNHASTLWIEYKNWTGMRLKYGMNEDFSTYLKKTPKERAVLTETGGTPAGEAAYNVWLKNPWVKQIDEIIMPFSGKNNDIPGIFFTVEDGNWRRHGNLLGNQGYEKGQPKKANVPQIIMGQNIQEQDHFRRKWLRPKQGQNHPLVPIMFDGTGNETEAAFNIRLSTWECLVNLNTLGDGMQSLRFIRPFDMVSDSRNGIVLGCANNNYNKVNEEMSARAVQHSSEKMRAANVHDDVSGLSTDPCLTTTVEIHPNMFDTPAINDIPSATSFNPNSKLGKTAATVADITEDIQKIDRRIAALEDFRKTPHRSITGNGESGDMTQLSEIVGELRQVTGSIDKGMTAEGSELVTVGVKSQGKSLQDVKSRVYELIEKIEDADLKNIVETLVDRTYKNIGLSRYDSLNKIPSIPRGTVGHDMVVGDTYDITHLYAELSYIHRTAEYHPEHLNLLEVRQVHVRSRFGSGVHDAMEDATGRTVQSHAGGMDTETEWVMCVVQRGIIGADEDELKLFRIFDQLNEGDELAVEYAQLQAYVSEIVDAAYGNYRKMREETSSAGRTKEGFDSNGGGGEGIPPTGRESFQKEASDAMAKVVLARLHKLKIAENNWMASDAGIYGRFDPNASPEVQNGIRVTYDMDRAIAEHNAETLPDLALAWARTLDNRRIYKNNQTIKTDSTLTSIPTHPSSNATDIPFTPHAELRQLIKYAGRNPDGSLPDPGSSWRNPGVKVVFGKVGQEFREYGDNILPYPDWDEVPLNGPWPPSSRRAASNRALNDVLAHIRDKTDDINEHTANPFVDPEGYHDLIIGWHRRTHNTGSTTVPNSLSGADVPPEPTRNYIKYLIQNTADEWENAPSALDKTKVVDGFARKLELIRTEGFIEEVTAVLKNDGSGDILQYTVPDIVKARSNAFGSTNGRIRVEHNTGLGPDAQYILNEETGLYEIGGTTTEIRNAVVDSLRAHAILDAENYTPNPFAMLGEALANPGGVGDGLPGGMAAEPRMTLEQLMEVISIREKRLYNEAFDVGLTQLWTNRLPHIPAEGRSLVDQAAQVAATGQVGPQHRCVTQLLGRMPLHRVALLKLSGASGGNYVSGTSLLAPRAKLQRLMMDSSDPQLWDDVINSIQDEINLGTDDRYTMLGRLSPEEIDDIGNGIVGRFEALRDEIAEQTNDMEGYDALTRYIAQFFERHSSRVREMHEEFTASFNSWLAELDGYMRNGWDTHTDAAQIRSHLAPAFWNGHNSSQPNPELTMTPKQYDELMAGIAEGDDLFGGVEGDLLREALGDLGPPMPPPPPPLYGFNEILNGEEMLWLNHAWDEWRLDPSQPNLNIIRDRLNTFFDRRSLSEIPMMHRGSGGFNPIEFDRFQEIYTFLTDYTARADQKVPITEGMNNDLVAQLSNDLLIEAEEVTTSFLDEYLRQQTYRRLAEETLKGDPSLPKAWGIVRHQGRSPLVSAFAIARGGSKSAAKRQKVISGSAVSAHQEGLVTDNFKKFKNASIIDATHRHVAFQREHWYFGNMLGSVVRAAQWVEEVIKRFNPDPDQETNSQNFKLLDNVQNTDHMGWVEALNYALENQWTDENGKGDVSPYYVFYNKSHRSGEKPDFGATGVLEFWRMDEPFRPHHGDHRLSEKEFPDKLFAAEYGKKYGDFDRQSCFNTGDQVHKPRFFGSHNQHRAYGHKPDYTGPEPHFKMEVGDEFIVRGMDIGRWWSELQNHIDTEEAFECISKKQYDEKYEQIDGVSDEENPRGKYYWPYHEWLRKCRYDAWFNEHIMNMQGFTTYWNGIFGDGKGSPNFNEYKGAVPDDLGGKEYFYVGQGKDRLLIFNAAQDGADPIWKKGSREGAPKGLVNWWSPVRAQAYSMGGPVSYSPLDFTQPPETDET